MADLVALQNYCKKQSLKSGEYSNKIRNKFKELDVLLNEKSEGLPTDLGDIKEICNNVIHTINTIESAQDKKELSKMLSIIWSNLYIHLPFHLKELKKPLVKLQDKLEEGK